MDLICAPLEWRMNELPCRVIYLFNYWHWRQDCSCYNFDRGCLPKSLAQKSNMNMRETKPNPTLSQLGATGLACNWIILLLGCSSNKKWATKYKKKKKKQGSGNALDKAASLVAAVLWFMFFLHLFLLLLFGFCGHCIGGDCVAFFTFAFNSQMLLLSVVWDGDEDEVVIRRRFFFRNLFWIFEIAALHITVIRLQPVFIYTIHIHIYIYYSCASFLSLPDVAHFDFGKLVKWGTGQGNQLLHRESSSTFFLPKTHSGVRKWKEMLTAQQDVTVNSGRFGSSVFFTAKDAQNRRHLCNITQKEGIYIL